MSVFKDNVRLLVAKTWVEGKDEIRKSDTLTSLDVFAGMVDAKDYRNAVSAFVELADAVAGLLFGEARGDPGFMDYVFRIDPRLGIFYWFVGQLGLQEAVDPDLAHIELLVGVYALASF